MYAIRELENGRYELMLMCLERAVQIGRPIAIYESLDEAIRVAERMNERRVEQAAAEVLNEPCNQCEPLWSMPLQIKPTDCCCTPPNVTTIENLTINLNLIVNVSTPPPLFVMPACG